MKHSDGQTVAGAADQVRKTKRQCRCKDSRTGDAAGDEVVPTDRSVNHLVASLRWALSCAELCWVLVVLNCYVHNHRAPVGTD